MRLPPVTEKASGIPLASTSRWCLDPFLARSTGLGPVAEPPFSPARGWSRRPRATTRSHPRRASAPTRPHAAAPTRPPAATHRGDASRSPPNRSRARPADASTRSPCATRTRSPATPADHRGACAPDSESAAPSSAKAARTTPTAHPRRSTARQRSVPPSLTTDADGVRRQRAGPFITKGALNSSTINLDADVEWGSGWFDVEGFPRFLGGVSGRLAFRGVVAVHL